MPRVPVASSSETIARFSAHLRDEAGLEALERTLVAVVDATMQPAHASVWLTEVHPQIDPPRS